MAKTQTQPWDAAEHLKTEEDMVAYLEAALEEGNPSGMGAPRSSLPPTTAIEVK